MKKKATKTLLLLENNLFEIYILKMAFKLLATVV